MSGRLAIFGASGHGRVVADAAALGGWDEIVFFDDRAGTAQGTLAGLLDGLAEFNGVIVGIGTNRFRRRATIELQARQAPLVNVLHPSAVISARARLGIGVFAAPLAVAGPDAEIGDGAILNTASSVDHDARIGPYAHIAPGTHLSGAVTVGSGAWIGIGSAVREGVVIGDWTMVGAGSVVVGNLPARCIAYGNPARPRRDLLEEELLC
jgi:sugar O-acyltransferase (sialic acid O-acetyltransferase NeuD family)